eukprot:g3427.t1
MSGLVRSFRSNFGIVSQKLLDESLYLTLTRFCSNSAAFPKSKELLTAEEKKINAIWTSACIAGNPNTTAVDFPPDLSRFVIPPSAYQHTPWLETPTTGFNPMIPWIDANIQSAKVDPHD